jgi:hypothetical protein
MQANQVFTIIGEKIMGGINLAPPASDLFNTFEPLYQTILKFVNPLP